MTQRLIGGVAVALLWCVANPAGAQRPPRYELGADRGQRQPFVETQWQEHVRTVYKPQYVTKFHDGQRTVHSQVIDYRMEPRWHNWWNPFGRPYIAYHMKPVVRWETRVDNVRYPVTQRELVPETRVVRVPTRRLGFTGPPTTPQLARDSRSMANLPSPPPRQGVNNREQLGGVSQIVDEPARLGTRPVLDVPPRRR